MNDDHDKEADLIPQPPSNNVDDVGSCPVCSVAPKCRTATQNPIPPRAKSHRRPAMGLVH